MLCLRPAPPSHGHLAYGANLQEGLSVATELGSPLRPGGATPVAEDAPVARSTSAGGGWVSPSLARRRAEQAAALATVRTQSLYSHNDS